jgi:hypothetical protein
MQSATGLVRKESAKKLFPSSIKLWNNLTAEIRSSPTVSNFKKSLINDVNLLKHKYNKENI